MLLHEACCQLISYQPKYTFQRSGQRRGLAPLHTGQPTGDLVQLFHTRASCSP